MGDELLDDVARRLRWLVLGGCVAGLAATTVSLIVGASLVHRVPHGRTAPWVVLRNLVWAGPVALAWAVAWWVSFRRRIEHIRSAMATHFRDPNDVELLLNLPKVATHPVVVWVISAIAAPVYNDGVVPTTQLPLQAAAIVLTGLCLAAALYPAAEAIARPLLRQALEVVPAGRPRPPGVRPRLIAMWWFGSGIPLMGVIVAAADARRGDIAATTRAGLWFVAGGGLLFGLGLTWGVAAHLARRLDAVRNALGQVEDGDLTVSVPVDDAGEIGMVQLAVNHMVSALSDRAKVTDLLGRHVGDPAARRALAHTGDLGGEERTATIMFVDVIGSTQLSQRHPPAAVVAMLNSFFLIVEQVVIAERGWINTFEGDAALCLFGAPDDDPDHAAAALRAARRLDKTLRGDGGSALGLQAGIGVSSGVVLAGTIGTPTRYGYTVIGHAANEAARITDWAKKQPLHVAASLATIELAAGAEACRWRSHASLDLRGIDRPVEVFCPAP